MGKLIRFNKQVPQQYAADDLLFYNKSNEEVVQMSRDDLISFIQGEESADVIGGMDSVRLICSVFLSMHDQHFSNTVDDLNNLLPFPKE